MNERFVASSPKTRYAQYDGGGSGMPTGDKIAETGIKTSSEVSGNRGATRKPIEASVSEKLREPLFKPLNRPESERKTIPFSEVRSEIEAIADVQDEQYRLFSPEGLRRFDEINIRYGDPEDARKQRTLEDTLVYAQEVLRNSTITEPQESDYDNAEEAALRLTLDKALIRKVQSRDEETLEPEKVKKYAALNRDKNVGGGLEKGSTGPKSGSSSVTFNEGGQGDNGDSASEPAIDGGGDGGNGDDDGDGNGGNLDENEENNDSDDENSNQNGKSSGDLRSDLENDYGEAGEEADQSDTGPEPAASGSGDGGGGGEDDGTGGSENDGEGEEGDDEDAREEVDVDNELEEEEIDPNWIRDLPNIDDVAEKLKPTIDELRRIFDISGKDPQKALEQLNLIAKTFSDMKMNAAFDINSPDFQRVQEAFQRGLEVLLSKLGTDQLADEFSESQYIYYGLTTMPRIRNLGAKDKLKHELGSADRLVRDALVSKELTPAEVKVLRGLSADDWEKFKDGKSDLFKKDGNIQERIYAALKRDQEVWLHRKIENLPWENLDESRIGNNLAYREFINAQSEMLPEVEEYSRALSTGSKLKYAFTKSGMEALKQNASVLKETLETLSKKAYGWNEVVSEIETFITREKLKEEDMDPGKGEVAQLRKQWRDKVKGVLKADYGKRDFADLTDKEKEEVRGKVLADFDEKQTDIMRRAAVGLYIYEVNEHKVNGEEQDGSVKFMRPKTSEEIETDKAILGKEEEWKVGGFVRGKSIDDVKRMREHLYKFAHEKLEAMAGQGVFTADEVKARSKIAAFMGEWVFWRMKGRSGYWGEQGGNDSPAGGGKGETDMFYVIGFQQFITQESKGNGRTGRVMRKLMVGADTADEFTENFVPGMAGGTNFNLGYLDFYSQYSAFYPGERKNKPMHDAGFIRGYGTDLRARVNRVGSIMETVSALTKSVGADKAWEIVRKRMSDRDKDFLDQYNNIPIVTLANKTSRDALAKIAAPTTAESPDKKGINPYNDAPDYYGSDFDGGNSLRGLMTEHDTGFLSEPDPSMFGAAARASEGRKRIWQRAKIMRDMAAAILEYKSFWNEKITGRDNWNSEDADRFLTDLRDEDFVVERTKRDLELDYFKRVVNKGLSRFIPFMENPLLHKSTFIYSKKPYTIALDTILAMILEFFKRLPSQTVGR